MLTILALADIELKHMPPSIVCDDGDYRGLTASVAVFSSLRGSGPGISPLAPGAGFINKWRTIMKHAIYSDHGSTRAAQQAAELLQHLTTMAVRQLRIWKHRSASRQSLARLSQYQLEDIGITELERQVEINKSFWEA
jgi:uncharacterized protein YjiS (DUF1127 family)